MRVRARFKNKRARLDIELPFKLANDIEAELLARRIEDAVHKTVLEMRRDIAAAHQEMQAKH
jgi:predicted component of type VI protein secretion system